MSAPVDLINRSIERRMVVMSLADHGPESPRIIGHQAAEPVENLDLLQRVKMLGGQIDFVSEPGQGAKVVARFPLTAV